MSTRDFRPGSCRNVRFSGDIRLGVFKGTLTSPGGAEQRRGIFDAALHNCSVGDDARIVSVTRYIANYDIGRGAIIEDIGTLAIDGETSFGNGTRVNVMIETGARNIPIFDRLSSQIAYLMTFERHRADALEAMEKLVADYVASVTSSRGEIGPGAQIIDCQRITNVRIGPAARVIGAVELENGSINSTVAAPSRVGSGVIARDFIFASGSVVDSGAQVQSGFVGQGAQLGEQFLAEHSLFFANAACLKGESCSIFAGPFTTTHHKATLLLTALYSFYNAGSGTNFSNHRYKLGPVHQGVLERGCKCGSSSYMIWPGKIGAFSLIVGKHFFGIETGEFPFSYILQDGAKTVLLPGANLFTIGVLRDGKKWNDRDRRTDSDLLDLYRTDVFGPYTIGRMIRGRDTLARLETEIPKDQEIVCWNGAEIPRERIRRGWLDYSLAVFCFLGRKVSMAAEAIIELSGAENIEQKIVSTKSWGLGDWSDLGGMMMPTAKIDLLLDDVLSGKLDSVAALEKSFKELHSSYPQMEWNLGADYVAEGTRQGPVRRWSFPTWSKPSPPGATRWASGSKKSARTRPRNFPKRCATATASTATKRPRRQTSRRSAETWKATPSSKPSRKKPTATEPAPTNCSTSWGKTMKFRENRWRMIWGAHRHSGDGCNRSVDYCLYEYDLCNSQIWLEKDFYNFVFSLLYSRISVSGYKIHISSGKAQECFSFSEFITIASAKPSKILPTVRVNWEDITKASKRYGGREYEFTVGDKDAQARPRQLFRRRFGDHQPDDLRSDEHLRHPARRTVDDQAAV